MPLILASLALGAIVAPFCVSRLGRRAFLILALIPAAAFCYAAALSRRITGGHPIYWSITWIDTLGLNLDFRLDTLGWLMVLVVAGIGALTIAYCARYFAVNAEGLGRFAAIMVAFAGSMLGLVTADNLLLLYVFWELTSVFSFILIGHYQQRVISRAAATQALLITTTGGLAMLAGFILIGQHAGTYRISELDGQLGTSVQFSVAAALILIGAITKSALVPTHFWLPAAMAAPTPVSAYLHAAAMVKAGVYVIARLTPLLAGINLWRPAIATIGIITMLYGGWMALRQYDLKLLLAYGTVSQLGFIAVLLGYGTRAAALAGLALLAAHAMFKAALFLTVGLIDLSTGTRDIRELAGFGRRMPEVAVAAAIATASMIGLPPLIGYVAKEAALTSFSDQRILTVALVLGSALTAGYGIRFWWGAFASWPTKPATPQRTRPARLLFAPIALLALASLAIGLIPGVLDRALASYADSYPKGTPGHLTLWPGWEGALLTAGILVLGLIIFVWTGPRGRPLRSGLPIPSAERIYAALMRGIDRTATSVTALTQRGSLPFHLVIILITFTVAVASPSIAAIIDGAPIRLYLWDGPDQLVIGGIIVAGAILAARSRRRLKAVLLASITGYGTALLFLLHGAPDLALTQILVETVTIVVFVLVLRELSPYFSNRPLLRSRFGRLAVAIAGGATMSLIAVLAPAARVAEPISQLFPEEAVAFGGGNNVVNVTLVDIRAWDTMGEISVLLAAATGIASLVFLHRRGGRVRRAVGRETRESVWGWGPDPLAGVREQDKAASAPAHTWLPAVKTLAPARRSLMFEVVTRIVFHAIIIFSLYLLFSGHNNPGGGFAAGLVAGLALVIRYLAAGRYELAEAAPINPGVLLGLGLFLSAGVGIVAIALGHAVLQSTVINAHLPIFGEIHLVTSLFFDIGVYLVVIGLILDILRSLGAQIDATTQRSEE